METRDLEYMLAVEAHGGVVRAAEALGLGQPALTKAIQRVEVQLGIPLFERTSRGMRPTQAGALFLERARRVKLEYEDALKAIKGISSGEKGLLRVCFSPTLPDNLAMGVCRQLLVERPVAQLHLRTRLARELVDALLAGELDLVVAPVPGDADSEFDVVDLFQDRVAVIADASHPLHRRKSLTLADLADQEWLLPGPHIVLRQHICAVFRDKGLPEPRLRIEADFANFAVFQLLQGTRMLSLSTSDVHAVVKELRPLDVMPAELNLRRRIGILSRRGAYLSPLAQRFCALLQERMR